MSNFNSEGFTSGEAITQIIERVTSRESLLSYL